MRTGNVRVVGAVAAAVVVAAFGSALAAESGDDEVPPLTATGADAELVAAMLAIESQLPEPLPTAVELRDEDVDAVLSGSFATARSALDRVEDDLRQLYVTADDSETAVGDRLSQLTRALLTERQALLVLEGSDGSADPRPLDASDARDDAGIAIDADGQVGQRTIGVDILLAARLEQALAYDVLAELSAEDEAGVFDARASQLALYLDTVGDELRRISTTPDSQLLVPVDRFDAPLGVARAVSATYVCVDRALYFELVDAPRADRVAAAAVEVPDPECVEAARRAGLSLADQQAAAAGDRTDTATDAGADTGTDG